MVDIIPTIELEIIDHGFIFASKLAKTNTKIKLEIYEGFVKCYDTIWLVKKFDIISANYDYMQFKVFGELDCAIPLYTTCTYATSKNVFSKIPNDLTTGENPYKIIKNILKQVGFNLYDETIFIEVQDGSNDEEDAEFNTVTEIVKSREATPFLFKLINFITNSNMYAIDAVKFLLAKAVGTISITPPAYLIYNLKDNKGFISTREQLFDNIKFQPASTNSEVGYFSLTKASLGKPFQIKDLKTDSIADENLVGGIESVKLFHNYNFRVYDHLDGTWSIHKVTKNEINDLLTKGMNSASQESVFVKQLNEDPKLTKTYDYPTINEQKMYDILMSLELFSSNIQFTVDGNIDLDVGQIINVKETKASELLDGQWMIIKIKHSFRDSEYTTNMICARTFYNK